MSKRRLSRGKILALIITAILFLDQLSKIWIKTHFTLHESIHVIGNWFQIYFVENEGMAFGMVFGGETGKLILSLFRIALSICIMWYIVGCSKNPKTPKGVL
jgi:signal peptidase II